MNKKSAFIVGAQSQRKMALEMVNKNTNVILVEFNF